MPTIAAHAGLEELKLTKNFRLAVVQNPFTWVAQKWNATRDCSPGRLMDLDACDRGRYSGLCGWGRDKFRLGQLTVDVDNVNFGVANYYNATPQLGLERSDEDVLYPTFLEVMQSQDLINTGTYGIYLGDIRGKFDTGKSITFGGIDTAKFQRPLRTYSSLSGYELDLFTIKIKSGSVTVSTPFDQPTIKPAVANLNFGTP
ncbi:hypothetical protein ABW20_dc0105100 [Dactylellina cionopaga]|nr:hypothetical protein ABW20_dc0105100 [Dactylellina cionopaga]